MKIIAHSLPAVLIYSRQRHALHVREDPSWQRPVISRVVTLVESSARPVIGEAVSSCSIAIHAQSLAEASVAARSRGIRALIVSADMLRSESLPNIVRLVAACPTVLVVRESDGFGADGWQALLELGRCGIRSVVDLSDREGFGKLRTFVCEANNDTASRILNGISTAIGPSRAEIQDFFSALTYSAPETVAVREFAKVLRVHQSTLMSRFYRAGLPSPKRFLAEMRLVYAARWFENGRASISLVANQLEYSSPQSFGRHIRNVMGMSAATFRYRYNFESMIHRYVNTLIVPYQACLQSFDPTGASLTRDCSGPNSHLDRREDHAMPEHHLLQAG